MCRVKQHRRGNGQPLLAYRRHPYGAEQGRSAGGLKVLVVRDGAKYDATNRLTLSTVEGRQSSRSRAQSAAVIRVCKDPLRLSGCQARSARAQVHHLTCGLVAFWVLERERQDQGRTLYKLKHQLSCRGRTAILPALERLKQHA